MLDEGKHILYFFDEIYDIKLIYAEIIRGFSYNYENEIYVKHLTELEKIEIIEKRQEIYKKTIKKGVKTDKQAIDYLISENLWSEEKETEIAQFELTIDDNTKQANLMISPNQKKVILDLVAKDQEKLNIIRQERANLVGLTAEKYSEDKYINFYLYYSFFKDKDLKKSYFTEEDFNNLEEEEILKYFDIYGSCMKNFTDKNFKKIAVSPFFLNSISFAYEDPRLFLDKSYNSYTSYQFELFSLGKRNVRVLSEATANSPVIHSRTLYQDLINWYDLQHTVNENAKKEREGSARGSVKSTMRSG